MLRRRLSLLLLAVLPACAGIWPDQIEGFTRASSRPIVPSDRGVWDEYGFQDAEESIYNNAAGKSFVASAWRLKDSTGALAVFQWQRPAAGVASKTLELGVELPEGLFVARGNYVLRFDRYAPAAEVVNQLAARLPRLEQAPLPTLAGYLPGKGRLAGSERYVVGPASLERFEPRILPSTAAFHMGAEAQLGRFRTGAGEMSLAIFAYPTHQIARQRLPEFEKLPGAMVKRSGPLLGVILSPPDADAAERLLALVEYKAIVTWNEANPAKQLNAGDLLVSIFQLTGYLLVFCAMAGTGFAVVRVLATRVGTQEARDPMILLHLRDK